jgi:uncharacterized protein YrrD
MTDKQDPEDLGAPVAYLVVRAGTPVFDASGEKAGQVEHVLADEQADVFHGLLIKTGNDHRFAPSAKVDGLFEHGVIISVPVAELPAPSADAAARVVDDESLKGSLKRAWDWLVQPH